MSVKYKPREEYFKVALGVKPVILIYTNDELATSLSRSPIFESQFKSFTLNHLRRLMAIAARPDILLLLVIF